MSFRLGSLINEAMAEAAAHHPAPRRPMTPRASSGASMVRGDDFSLCGKATRATASGLAAVTASPRSRSANALDRAHGPSHS